ncbi:Uncharacterised protein [Klebsiella pneumoniae]|uniref:Uncharacterized protein n=1 Tax=Klebsiella pneumoniae TaxID=573 RepID=A0A377UT31_KLEPN|nr:Uncharacterised protein [Klebsiella pneumoniae]
MCDKKYRNYEVAIMVDVNPFDRVMNELKSRGRKNAHILSILQFDWPASGGHHREAELLHHRRD